jgi:hypothetical protein
MSVFDGLTKGADKGFQHIADGFKFLEMALKSGDGNKIESALHLVQVFLGEIADESGVVKHNFVNLIASAALGLSHDPFSASRELQRTLEEKYNFHPHKNK